MRFSNRVHQLTPSATVELNSKIAEMHSKGIPVIAFSAGEPDFGTPDTIKEAAKNAIDDNFTRYTPAAGIMSLREAISQKLNEENHLPYSPEQICISNGAKQALTNALMALCQEGDEVILPTPCWVSYMDLIRLSGAIPVPVSSCRQPDRLFELDLEAIEQAITPCTRAIIVNTPNNPTGAVYSLKSLLALGNLAVKYDITIISDEVYEKLVYEGHSHISIGSLSPEIFEHTVTINAFSKSYAMTGWRVGYTAASVTMTKLMTGIQGHMTSNINSIAQKAALAALTGPQNFVREMQNIFAARRTLMRNLLCSIPGITCADSQGAFYLMPDVSAFLGRELLGCQIQTSADLARLLLEHAHIAVVPGEAFQAPGYLRMSYSVSEQDIRDGIARMKDILVGAGQGTDESARQ